MSTWVDFKALRAKLRFEQVLAHYKVEIKRKGNHQHTGFCPLPNHNGKRNSPSFSANLDRGIFQCFGCGAKGNLLEFAALMENVSPEDRNGLRAVALDLQKRFCAEDANLPRRKVKMPDDPPKPETIGLVSIINAALDFELKGLDYDHPYLRGRKFRDETIRHFGLGYCSRGYFANRIAIPLHDFTGKLIGYAGRVIDDKTVSEDNPRYILPGRRNYEGKVFDFRKSLFLYNGNRIAGAPLDDLVVVEGFTAVWWLHQHGIRNVVATMGADCSETHAVLITSLTKHSSRVWIMPDGNEAGERLAKSIFTQVALSRFVRWVKLKDDCQPTNLSAEQLKNHFTF